MQKKINNRNNLESKDFDYSELFYKYLPYWPLLTVLMLVAVACAYIYLHYTVPIYEVSANILIKDEKKGMNESSILESLNMFGSKKIVENEIGVLKSRNLMKEVVENLDLYAPISEKGRIKDVSAYLSSPVKLEAKHPDLINPSGKVYFDYNKANNTIVLANKSFSLNQWFVFKNDTLRFVPNTQYRKPAVERPLYFTLLNAKATARALIDNIDISASSRQSTVINFRSKDPIPKRGEDILNELIRVYNKAAIQDKNVLAANTLAFIENRLKFVVSDLDSVESAVQRFKTRKGIVDISSQGQLFLESVKSTDEEVSHVNMQMAVLDQVEQYVVSKEKNSGIVPSTLGVDDPILSQLLQRLYELEIEQERLRKTTAENNPILVSVQDQIEKVKPGILENIRNQRRNLAATKGNLSQTSNKYSSLLRTIPQQERELLEITRQQEIKNNIYTFLLQKREETALSYASAVADTRVVDNAEAGIEPISPKKKLVYLSSIAGALALGIGFLSLKELFNRNVQVRAELEKYISWPIVAELTQDRSKRAIVIGKDERKIIAEQFRQLRSSLAYLGINERNKKILVTSSISGEGKTFVAANLAISLALTNKKVVLIELDLRKPKLSQTFKVSRDIGLTNYLIGQTKQSEIIKQTEINENLYFISSGPIPPNPSELILNAKMEQLINDLNNEFDYVIIDTAPIAPVTDAYILSKYCDATLFVVRQDYTPKVFIKKLEETNSVRELKNVAIIFNGINERGAGKYGYTYDYSYGEALSDGSSKDEYLDYTAK